MSAATSTQPSADDLRVIGEGNNCTRAVAVSGPHMGKRFVRIGGAAWLRAGDATDEEMGFVGQFNRIFDALFHKGGAA